MVYREWKLYCWELEFFHSVRCQPRLTEGGLHAESSKIAQVLVCRLLPANILNRTPKSCRREGLFSFSWIFVSGRKELRFRLRSWRVNAGGQSPNTLRFCLSHFPCRRTSSKRIGPQAAPRSFCGDVPLVNTIRSSATDAASNRRTMNTTTGSGSVAVAAPVSG